MTKAKVVFMTSLPRKLEEFARLTTPKGFVTTAIASKAREDEKIEVLSDADFILGLFPNLSEAVLRHTTKLKLLQLASVGYDTVDLKLLEKYGVTVATCGDINSAAVAEHTISLMLAICRKLTQCVERVKLGGWIFDSPATDAFTYHNLIGKRVGLVGFGNIGRNVAQRLQGFQCAIQVYNRTVISEEHKKKLGVEQVEFLELLKTSDIISLHVPLTPETRHLIGRKELMLMKPSAILINTSRGALIDEAALIEVLQERQIFGAGLDVIEKEPPEPDNLLRTMSNIVLTPHIGGASLGTLQEVFRFCWQNIKDTWDGKMPHNVVSSDLKSF